MGAASVAPLGLGNYFRLNPGAHAPGYPSIAALRLGLSVPKMSVEVTPAMERRRRGRYLAWGTRPGYSSIAALRLGLSVPKMSVEVMPAMERRRRGRYLAWGVSPRNEETNQRLSPRRGRQKNGG
jgi:hypothetical protein